jgi:modulator of FtsH protease
MEAGPLQGWTDFFVAGAGASAALAGLLFVAVSINLSRILEYPTLPIRAIETLFAFLSVLAICTLGLIPHLTPLSYAAAFIAAGTATWMVETSCLVRTWSDNRRHGRIVSRILLNQLPPLFFVVAGVMLALGRAGAAVWIAPGVGLSYVAGVIGAWVLLVEIQR